MPLVAFQSVAPYAAQRGAVTGVIIDRLHAPFVCAFVFCMEAAAFASLGLIGVRYAWIPILAIGLAHGAEVDCFTYCTARYFGLKACGVFFGLIIVMTAVGNGFGPLLFAFVHAAAKSYGFAFCMDSAFAIGAALLLVMAGRIPYFDSGSSVRNEGSVLCRVLGSADPSRAPSKP